MAKLTTSQRKKMRAKAHEQQRQQRKVEKQLQHLYKPLHGVEVKKKDDQYKPRYSGLYSSHMNSAKVESLTDNTHVSVQSQTVRDEAIAAIEKGAKDLSMIKAKMAFVHGMNDDEIEREIEAINEIIRKRSRVGVAYNKGAYQYITDDVMVKNLGKS